MHRSTLNKEIASGYGQWSGTFLSPNPCLTGSTDKDHQKMIDGSVEYKREWDESPKAGLAKCSIFVGDVLFEAKMVPPINDQKHYYLAGQFTECKECGFLIRTVDHTSGGNIVQLYGSAKAYDTHIAILDDRVERKRIKRSDIRGIRIGIMKEEIRELDSRYKAASNKYLKEELKRLRDTVQTDLTTYEASTSESIIDTILSEMSKAYDNYLKKTKKYVQSPPVGFMDRVEFELWDFWIYEAHEVRSERTHRPIVEAERPFVPVEKLPRRKQIIVAVDTSITEDVLNAKDNIGSGGVLIRDPYMIVAEAYEGLGKSIRFLESTKKMSANWSCPYPQRGSTK